MYPYWVLNDLFGKYKRRSRLDGTEFTLTKEEFLNIITKNCEYCDAPPSNSNKGHKYSGIDRKNNDLGYTPSNSVPCCKNCNVVKNNVLSFEEMSLVMSFVLKLRGIRKSG